jgi:cellulose synthase/poly-beta-1,6-N-acetylglucosamine synthase-like glycosyltransferase
VNGTPLATTLVTCAIAYLLAAYAFGGPILLIRTLVGAIGERRLRYRGRPDDALASSRFTIPVSIVLPTRGASGVGDAVEHLLGLQYPEVEVIVVNDGTPGVLDDLRERFALQACEVFFRRTLPTGRVGGIFRSITHDKLLVVECDAQNRADAFNCGVNLSRYRYVCCADSQARYAPGALLEAMHPAVEDPATVVGVSTTLGPFGAGPATPDDATDSLVRTLQRLSALRGVLSRNLRRRLRLSPESLPGFSLWRRDVIVESGGFSLDVPSEQLEMTFRLHRHMLRAGQPYRMVQLATPVGEPAGESPLGAFVARRLERQHSLARVMWQYRSMIFNPRYRALGMLDLPRYLFAMLVVPWLELACLLALPFATVAGVRSPGQLLLVCAVIALGNGILLNAAMLLAPWPADQAALVRLLLLAPFEVFVSRPVQLYSRLVGVLRVVVSRAGPAAA